MPRIQPDDAARFPPDKDEASFATMLKLFGTMGSRPGIMQAAMHLLDVTMREGTVERELKELLAIRVSQVNNCFY